MKLHREEPKVSYLSYPAFETDAHPALASILTVHLQNFRVKVHDYRTQRNRPILHRKELFVTPDHPDHAKLLLGGHTPPRGLTQYFGRPKRSSKPPTDADSLTC